MVIRIAKVGSRNRVVLPPEVMDALGVGPGDALFFVVGQNGVRISRGPETFGEYLQLHAGALPALEDPEDLDPNQMRFDWHQENLIRDEHSDR
jgi:bifunctional DNA-binding transcriptional regulator/antitoxin component of YhaV-PrlF toxin-antitoxin module